MAAPTFDELFDVAKAEQILRRPELAVRTGDISEMLLSASAAVGDRVVGWTADRIAATFLDGAVGDDLTLLAADHWGIQRRVATSALALVTFQRSGADATAQNLPIGTTVATEADSQGNSVQFSTTQTASWGVSVNGTVQVQARAVIAGSQGNLRAANLLTRLVSTPPTGGTYTITASTLPTGGAEEETDEELRDRVRLYPSTLRRGTLPALEYGAKTVTEITVAKATAIQDATGLVTVYVADSDGNSTGDIATVGPNTQNQGTMTTIVAVELYNWAPAGALVNVAGGSVQSIDISVTIAVRLGVDVTQLITDIQDSISNRINKLGIGATLYLSEIINAVKAVDPDNIVNVVVTAPLVDTVPSSPGNLLRAGAITVS